ncbi:MAG TPA: DPP IV N-terminal domain-containing protein [Bryobacteraceae bacterium]|jgi:dipeptidyl-peptidase-4
MRKLALVLLLASPVFAQKKPVTLETLSQEARRGRRAATGPELWMPDGRSFLERQGSRLSLYDCVTRQSKTVMDLDEIDAAAVAPPAEEGPMDWTNRRAGLESMQLSASGNKLLYTARGDIFVIHLDTGKWEQLTKTPVVERDARLSPDGKTVAFRRGSDLYTVDVASKREIRLTRDGSETLRNGSLDWVYPEELELHAAYWWSPDSKSIAYLQFGTEAEPPYPHEDLLHMRAIYEPERYPQAGEPNAAIRLGVVSAAGGPTSWYELGDTRDAYLIARAGWMPGSRALYVLRFNRVQNRDALLSIDVESGASATIFEESDPYWINLKGDIRFLEDGKHFLWTSERGPGGYRQIFLYSNDGRQVQQLTSGAWEISEIAGVDEAAGRVFYISDEPNHLGRNLYAIGLDGQNKRRLSLDPGTHSISIGPGGLYYVDTWSNLSEPPRSVLHSGDGADLGIYREPDRSALDEYEILPTEIVPFTTPDGVTLYGRLIKPAGYERGKRYPVIVSIYGGPGVGLPVHDAWPGINIDQVLAQKGYVVWQCENRGGEGRGHDFETAIYHKLGVIELADQVAGVRHLIAMGIADPERIGIHGWSYGGFMTVNAMLNAADVFKAGFAGAPVTSWINYDTIYTERYMGLPKDNPDGYRDAALPLKAKNLKGRLMLVHNFEDDNVLFQNSIQLTSALQLAGKQFEYMLYPQKTHAVSGPDAQQMNQMMVDFFERSLR